MTISIALVCRIGTDGMPLKVRFVRGRAGGSSLTQTCGDARHICAPGTSLCLRLDCEDIAVAKDGSEL